MFSLFSLFFAGGSRGHPVLNVNWENESATPQNVSELHSRHATPLAVSPEQW